MKAEEFQTKEKEQTTIAETFDFENKRIGAFIKHSCSDELDIKLKFLADYQEKNNIEKIDWFYTGENGDYWAYYKAITDIFEENIDILLVVGDLEEITPDYEILEKIEQNVELIRV